MEEAQRKLIEERERHSTDRLADVEKVRKETENQTASTAGEASLPHAVDAVYRANDLATAKAELAAAKSELAATKAEILQRQSDISHVREEADRKESNFKQQLLDLEHELNRRVQEQESIREEEQRNFVAEQERAQATIQEFASKMQRFSTEVSQQQGLWVEEKAMYEQIRSDLCAKTEEMSAAVDGFCSMGNV